MAWFWKKKEAGGNDAAVAQQMVAAASANGSQRTEQDWAKLAKEQQKEEKRREKAMERAAKQAMKEMKDEVKKAQKARAKAEKEVKKQVKAVRKQQEQETKQQRKLEQKEIQQQKKLEKKQAKQVKIQAKASKRALRDQARRRKRAIRLRKKEEKRRRKQNKQADAQLREQNELERQRVQALRETDALQTMHTAFSRMESVEEEAAVAVREAPKFKESKCCESCNTKFKRLPNYRRHHCRNCGDSFCGKCLSNVKRPIPWFQLDKPQKVCFTCDVQVFNGMGGVNKDGEQSVASVDGQSASSVAGVASSHAQAESPVQRSVSQASEHPEDDSPRASPPSSRRFISLRPRSRRDNTSSKSSKKNSLWTLPIRPLLKRKASADQLRNRSWDLDLLLEKEEMLSRQRKSQMVLVSGPPQFAQAV